MSQAENIARRNLNALAENSYPGRGIVIGRTTANQMVQVYWVMGRSENSRNRILERAPDDDGDLVRTAPFDVAKVEDPSLIIYNAMREQHWQHIVSNGDQTDTVIESLRTSGGAGPNAHAALRTRTYEPDAPNYTPRITGATNGLSGQSLIWLTRRFDQYSGEPEHSYFKDDFTARAIGRCIHTYRGDGNPLPSFAGRPYLVPVGEDAEDTAEMFWQHLDADNRVALVAKTIELGSEGQTDYHIINKLGA